jgi:hypothetical protein
MALVLAIATIPVAAQGFDADVQKGIAQVDDGDYDGAILTLDNAARRLAADRTKSNDLAQAYLYLGIAYIGKGRDAAAKAKFREAVAQIKTLSLSADKFPPKVVDLFEAAKAEEVKATAAPSPTPSSSASGAGPAEKKKGGSKTILVIGGIAVAGGAAVLAAGGGSSNSAPKTPTDSRNSLTFSGTLPNSSSYTCYTVVATKAGTLDATLTWTNGQIEFGIGCSDPANLDCGGTYNRTSNVSAKYTVAVSQKTYQICPYNNSGRPDPYNLVILFP